MARTLDPPTSATVRVLRSAEDALAVREAWDALAWGHPDARLDTFLSVVETLPGARRPHVLAHVRDGRVDALLAARLEDRELPARFGYATPYRPAVRALTVIAGGGAGEPQALEALVRELYAELDRGEADVALFQHLEVGSALHRAALLHAPGWRRQRLLGAAPHRVMDLPGSAGELLPSLPKRLRDNFKRSRKMVHKQFGERATIRRFDAPEELEEALGALESIAARTYQRGLGAGFDASRDRPLVRLGLEQGWFRAWVLSIDGVPRAFELGSVHDGRLIVGAKGYDPDFAKAEIGTALQLHVLEELAGDPQIDTVDFGFGDADYKRRLATRHWDEVDVLVHGRTPRALTALAGRTAVLGADRLARRAVGPERIGAVKRRWRALRTPHEKGRTAIAARPAPAEDAQARARAPSGSASSAAASTAS